MIFYRRKIGLPLLALHWIIIINFVIQIFYASYMVFMVLRPKGVSGPLWGAAMKLVEQQPNLMLTRRAYATETWLAIGGLAIYLAITEIGPRMWGVAPSPEGEGQ